MSYLRNITGRKSQKVGTSPTQAKSGWLFVSGILFLPGPLSWVLHAILQYSNHPYQSASFLSILLTPGQSDLAYRLTSLILASIGGAVAYTLYQRTGSTGPTAAEGADRTEHQNSQKLAASVFERAAEGILITDEQGTILDINRAFSDITGYEKEEVLGKNPRILKSGLHRADFYRGMWDSLVHSGDWAGEIWNRHRSGEFYAEYLSIGSVLNDDGRITNYVGVFSDITAIKQDRKKLEELSHFDPLTGLSNRQRLTEHLRQDMREALEIGRQLAVVYIDLDNFQTINETRGHSTGDQVLGIIAERIKQLLRSGDTLARPGGDELVAVIPGLNDPREAIPVLTRILTAAAVPVTIEQDNPIQLSASLGVTFYPQEEQLDADQLIRQADYAMYQAKTAGRNRYCMFDTEVDKNARGFHETLETIRQGLYKKEFFLYYQPRVNMKSGQVEGAEALIRWNHPSRGILAPGEFLPVVQNQPLSIVLGEWVLDTAFEQLSQWHQAGLKISMGINIDVYHFQHGSFVKSLARRLEKYADLDPACIELELLETSAVQNFEQVVQIMEECRSLGVDLALDDFGTGYSSLTYLKRLPFTRLKIDSSFVINMLEDTDDLAILGGVMGLSRAFRMETTAEGLEKLEQGEMMIQLGCEQAQGFAIAHPMPPEELMDWVDEWRPHPSWAGTEEVSRDDLPLLFAEIEHRSWIERVIGYMEGNREKPPQLDEMNCRFGMWYYGPGLQRYSHLPQYKEIEQIHTEVHQLTTHILQQVNEAGEPSIPLSEYRNQLYSLRDRLISSLHRLLSYSQANRRNGWI